MKVQDVIHRIIDAQNADPFDAEATTDVLTDAMELLKKQEAVKPVSPEDEFGLYRCGKCYHQLFRCVDKYCSRCGQAVKWDES